MKDLYRIISITLLVILPGSLFAGGFQVNLQGQKQTGMGHAGTGLILGASSAFFNPGAFSFVDSNHIYLGGSFIVPRTIYLEPYPGTYTAQPVRSVGTPFTFYSSFRLKPTNKWNFGLAVYTPFGSGIKYEDDWKGQFILREMSLKTIFIQPTFGYQVNDKLGIGIGYIYGFGDLLLRKAPPIADMNNDYGEGKLTGKASGHGFNTGIYYKATDKQITVLDSFTMDAPSTKSYVAFLNGLNLSDSRTLLITADVVTGAHLSARNIPNAEVSTCDNLNTYSILKAKNLIFTEEAVNKLTENFKAN